MNFILWKLFVIQMSFPTFNDKTRQDIALGQVFTGIVEGRKSPKHDLYLGTDEYYENKMLLTAPCQR